jgi:hypothetical protein
MPTNITRSGSGPKLPDRGFVLSLGQAALGQIKKRTREGKGADDKAFAPYSRGYTRALTRASQQASPVDLHLTGRLLGSLRVRAAKFGAAVVSADIFAGTGPAGETKLAEGHIERKGNAKFSLNQLGYWLHHGNGNTPARPWLGLPKHVLAQLWQDLWASRRK